MALLCGRENKAEWDNILLRHGQILLEVAKAKEAAEYILVETHKNTLDFMLQLSQEAGAAAEEGLQIRITAKNRALRNREEIEAFIEALGVSVDPVDDVV